MQFHQQIQKCTIPIGKCVFLDRFKGAQFQWKSVENRKCCASDRDKYAQLSKNVHSPPPMKAAQFLWKTGVSCTESKSCNFIHSYKCGNNFRCVCNFIHGFKIPLFLMKFLISFTDSNVDNFYPTVCNCLW